MTLNPFALAARAFYIPFKAAILAAYRAARADALTEIRAELPGDADFAEVATALAELRDGSEAIGDAPERKKKK